MTTTPPTTDPGNTGASVPAPPAQRVYTQAFILMFLLELTVFVVYYMLLPTVPLYIRDLGGTQATVGWVIGIAGPVAALGVPLYGWGVDRWSRKGMIIVGLAINVVGALLMILVVAPMMMLIPTILRRIGSGATGSGTRTMILDIAPPSRRGEALTNFATSHNIAIAFGPALGLAIYASRGPATLFVVSAVVMAMAGLFLLPIRRTDGAATQGRAPDPAVSGAPARREGRLDRMIVRESLVPAVVVLLLSAAYLPTTTFVSILGEERAVPNYGSFFVVYAVVVISGRLLTGRVSDRYGRAIVLLPSLALAVGCTLVLAFTHSTTGFLVAAFMLGLGFGTGQPMTQAIAADWSPPEKYGRTMAMMMGAFSLGSAAGTVFVGEVSTRSGFTAAFIGLALMAVLALLIAIIGFRRRGVPLFIRHAAVAA